MFLLLYYGKNGEKLGYEPCGDSFFYNNLKCLEKSGRPLGFTAFYNATKVALYDPDENRVLADWDAFRK